MLLNAAQRLLPEGVELDVFELEGIPAYNQDQEASMPTRVLEFNDQVRRLRAIVDSARPQIDQLVSNVVTTTFDRPIASAQLRAWREQVNSHVARDAGFAYQAYVRLKLASVRAFGAELIVKLRGVPAQSPLWRVVTEIIDAYCKILILARQLGRITSLQRLRQRTSDIL